MKINTYAWNIAEHTEKILFNTYIIKSHLGIDNRL